MKKVILIRYGEIMLKGLNRRLFEDRLAANIRRVAIPFGPNKVSVSQGRLYLEPENEAYDLEAAAAKVIDVFGIVSVSIAWKVESKMEAIKACAVETVQNYIENHPPTPGRNGAYAFKVETKRGDKRFPLTSQMISSEVGGYLDDQIDSLLVDIPHPGFIVYLEVRESSYVYRDIIKGYGGLPLGTNGRALLLLSGGIDSPVAGFMMAKRGVQIEAIHFDSQPYTSDRSREKVLKLAEILSGYFYRLNVHIVPFTDILLAIRDNCHEEYLTLVMRRFMMVIAEKVAHKIDAQALITGESMGQVASQTILSLGVTNSASTLPIFRPLIGMDKCEVISLAEKIGTYETSILPFQDCCTVFTPKHPKTKPKLSEVVKQELCIHGADKMIETAIQGIETVIVRADEVSY